MNEDREPPAGAVNEAGGTADAFAALGLNESLAGKLAASGIGAPTAVQAAAIPALLAGRDGVLRSPTGTGKTLAYLLPLLQRIDLQRRETQAVVLAPTQELAMQIVRVAEAYGEPLGVKTVALIGGAALSRQLERMKARPALVVGTPGRVREVVSLRKLPLHVVRMVAVDETDRVFSLGGKRDVETLLKGASRERQTIFVSATRSEAMREAEERWLTDPFETGEAAESETGLPDTIEHWFFVSDRRDRIDLVRRIVRSLRPESALLFVNDTELIGELVAKLRFEGFAADALYGDTPGRERGEVMRKFREGRTKLLIATDVAARGLDVPGLPLVVQFEPALDADHYVHRAGRTGRMGRAGRSITIVTPQEKFIMTKLGKKLGIDIAEKRLWEGRVVGKEAPGRERKPAPRGESRGDPAEARTSGGRPDAGKPVGGKAQRLRSEPGRAAPSAKSGSAAAGSSTSAAKPRSVEPGGPAPAKPPQQRPPAAKPFKAAKIGADRERDRKNKGAPRWLKEKRNPQSPD